MSRLGAVILAAGASSRMGRPKLLLPWGSTTIIGHILGVWQTIGVSQVTVVTAGNTIDGELDRLAFPESSRILNPEPNQGMFSSIKLGARWTRWAADLAHLVFILGDQPQIKETTLRSLLACVLEDKIYQPAYLGRPRHPVIVPKRLLPELACSTCETLKEFLQRHKRDQVLVELADESLEHDLDTPADYSHALARYNEKSRIA